MPDMNENAETQQEYFGRCSKVTKNHWYEMYELERLKTKELKAQNAQSKQIISKILKAMEKAVITYEPKSNLTDVLNEARVFVNMGV